MKATVYSETSLNFPQDTIIQSQCRGEKNLIFWLRAVG